MTYSNNHVKTLSPSQIINLPIVALGIVTAPLVVLSLFAVYKLLDYYFWRYEFYEKTIVERRGVFNVTRKELHYYRIKSVYVEEPLLFRIFDLSIVHIKTSDPYLPELRLYGIENGKVIKELLENTTYNERNSNNVREFDMYHLNDL